MPTLIHTELVSWQLEQPPVTPAWICALPGGGVAKPLPGGVRLALAEIRPAGMEARWQLSQVIELGICEFAPAGDVGGMTTMLLIPAKLLPVIDGPWQSAQPLPMPV